MTKAWGSDLALLRPLPLAIVRSAPALVSGSAGAVWVSGKERTAWEAGLTDLVLGSRPDYVDNMADWQDPLYREVRAHLPPGTKPGDFITSLEITARKPAAAPSGAISHLTKR